MNLSKMFYATIVPFIIFVVSYLALCLILGKDPSTLGMVMVTYLACAMLFYVLPVTSVANKYKLTTFYDSAAWKPGLIMNTIYALFFVILWIGSAENYNKGNSNEAEGLGVIISIMLTFMLSVLFFVINSVFANDYAKREYEASTQQKSK